MPDKLTDEEWEVMRKHPLHAYELLSSITYLKPALDIPYTHHEKWDGSGYPRRLKGEQFHLRRASSPSWMYGMRSQVIVLIARVGGKEKALEIHQGTIRQTFRPKLWKPSLR